MSLASATNRVDYTGNGNVDTYAYTFKIFSDTDLLVTVRNTSDVESTLTLTTDYTVTGAGSSSGGNVVLVNSAQSWLDGDGDLKSGYVLSIRRVRPLTQTTDIRNQGDFYPEAHENAFDHLVMLDHQQQDELDRAMKLPETVVSAAFDAEIPAALVGEANKVLMTNDDGDGWEVGPSSSDISSAQTYATNASTSATAAATSATAAATSATAAASSATAAAAAAQSAIWNDVVFLTSNTTLDSTYRGKLVCVDTTGGTVTLTLPQISGLSLATPFVIGVKKTDASGNTVVIARAGTDTIDGATSKTITVTDSGCALIPDTDTSPDEWTSADFGAQAGNLTVDLFSGNGSNTTVTLSVDPGSENNTFVFLSGLYQQKDTYSVSGTTLTFSSAPPSGTNNIQVVSGTTLSIGTPSDGTVTKAKLAAGALSGDVVSITGATTLTSSHDVVLASSSGGAFQIDLPAAASNADKIMIIKKTSSDLNAITIEGNGAETIDGATSTTLNTQYESIEIVCDGSNWHIVKRHIPSVWTSYTPTGSFTNCTYTGFWRRVGDSIEIKGRGVMLNAPGATTLTVTFFPSGISMDTAKIVAGSRGIGSSYYQDFGVVDCSGTVHLNGDTTIAFGDTDGNSLVTQAQPFAWGASDYFSWSLDAIPVSGWKG
jgi:hypothetical protein